MADSRSIGSVGSTPADAAAMLADFADPVAPHSISPATTAAKDIPRLLPRLDSGGIDFVVWAEGGDGAGAPASGGGKVTAPAGRPPLGEDDFLGGHALDLSFLN